VAVSGADIAAIITAAGGAVAAVLGAVALVRKKAGELGRAQLLELDECGTAKRAAIRWVWKLLDLLAEYDVPEPEGIRDELGLRRRAGVAAAEDEPPS
jgi:hypothetical protein